MALADEFGIPWNTLNRKINAGIFNFAELRRISRAVRRPLSSIIAIAERLDAADGAIAGAGLKQLGRFSRLVTRDNLDDALDDSRLMRDVRGKLDRDWDRFDRLDRELRAARLDLLRVELFAHTNNRTQHERQLEAGKEYLDMGGNGYGHARYDALRQDYLRREADCDWSYR